MRFSHPRHLARAIQRHLAKPSSVLLSVLPTVRSSGISSLSEPSRDICRRPQALSIIESIQICTFQSRWEELYQVDLLGMPMN